MPAGGQVTRLLENFPAPEKSGGKLGKLKAVMEVARVLQNSLSSEDVLAAVVDAALAVTGAERGFLLLGKGDELEMRVARDRSGNALAEGDLKVPRRLIRKALHDRRDLLSMNFDHGEAGGVKAEHSVADLELRSVVCVPLVRIRVARRGDQYAFLGPAKRRECSIWIRALAPLISRREIANYCRRWRSKPRPFSRTPACSKRSAANRRSKKSSRWRARFSRACIRAAFRRRAGSWPAGAAWLPCRWAAITSTC